MSPRTRAPRRAREPRPTEIAQARARARLTQREAAALVHTTDRVWRQWEAGDYQMHPAFWELFQIKARSVTALAALPVYRTV